MVRINQDITVDRCICNDAAVLAVSDEDEKKRTWKCCREKIIAQSLQWIIIVSLRQIQSAVYLA